MSRLIRTIWNVIGFIIALVVLAKIYGPTDSYAVKFAIVCLAVMLGSLVDLIAIALIGVAMCAIIAIGWAAYALGAGRFARA